MVRTSYFLSKSIVKNSPFFLFSCYKLIYPYSTHYFILKCFSPDSFSHTRILLSLSLSFPLLFTSCSFVPPTYWLWYSLVLFFLSIILPVCCPLLSTLYHRKACVVYKIKLLLINPFIRNKILNTVIKI